MNAPHKVHLMISPVLNVPEMAAVFHTIEVDHPEIGPDLIEYGQDGRVVIDKTGRRGPSEVGPLNQPRLGIALTVENSCVGAAACSGLATVAEALRDCGLVDHWPVVIHVEPVVS